MSEQVRQQHASCTWNNQHQSVRAPSAAELDTLCLLLQLAKLFLQPLRLCQAAAPVLTMDVLRIALGVCLEGLRQVGHALLVQSLILLLQLLACSRIFLSCCSDWF